MTLRVRKQSAEIVLDDQEEDVSLSKIRLRRWRMAFRAIYFTRVLVSLTRKMELGIGIVPYSPLGKGFFGGRAVVESIPANSFLPSLPRFTGENFDKNKILYWKIEKLAETNGCTTSTCMDSFSRR
ncbi:hypothetical protein LWI28_002772 [Acer negundo]|uniref:Uncharacterized protein n=1 Tax=Acer negundo TaxID=4023 RepID=A0AAD5J3M6_ACENE|nr:hypothetical protein LWI28_002772 [Acer negundo]